MGANSVLAQDMSIGGLGAAGAMSASMSTIGPGAVGGAARGRARGAGMRAGADADEEGAPGAGATGGAPVAAAGGVASAPSGPMRWGPDSGSAMLRQLMAVPSYPAAGSKRLTSRQQAAYARRLARMTPAQRKRMIARKYQIAPAGWIGHYLKEDRYKITYKVWKYVTTPNDRFYYRPSAAAMMRKPAGQVVGFHTWQDAMIAGYRPDPVSKPEPGNQIAYLAGLTRGPKLARYVEYVYAGQISPQVFNLNQNYFQQVARVVNSRPYTRRHLGRTLDQVIGAAIGEGSIPQYIGGSAPPMMAATPNLAPAAVPAGAVTAPGAMGGPGMAPGMPPGGGGDDPRRPGGGPPGAMRPADR